MVNFSNDLQVTRALEQWRGRELMPTDLGSAELRQMASEVRERAVFSACVSKVEFLQEIAETVDEMLSGTIGQSTGRLRLMRRLGELGYSPEEGFPEDVQRMAPAERDSLQDLSSEKRLDLILETNQRMAANYGRMKAGAKPYALWAYPAWQLVRLYLRTIERGSPESHTDGWQQRWAAAGDAVGWQGAHRTELIALKNSPIWQALGDGAGDYTDTLGNPYPPFAFRSGMAWRAVPRPEARALGLLDGQAAPGPLPPAQLSAGAKEVNAVFAKLSPELQAALREELAA